MEGSKNSYLPVSAGIGALRCLPLLCYDLIKSVSTGEMGAGESVLRQTADAGGGRSTTRHTAYDHNFHLAPSTIAAISDLGR